MLRLLQGASAGAAVRRRQISCNGGGGATAGEFPIVALRPIARSTPVRRQGQPQTNIRTCGQTRESEHDHRRLKAPPPPLHDHRFDNL